MELFDLGNMQVSGFVDTPIEKCESYPLKLQLCNRYGAPKLAGVRPAAKEMWGTYWYKSGVNAAMVDSLANVVSDIEDRLGASRGHWLDIAANDGTLLKNVPSDFYKVAIDPVEQRIFSEAVEVSDFSCNDYFSFANWERAVGSGEKARVITCVSMFYDLEKPSLFLADCEKILDDDGLIVLQMSYTPFMVMQNAFDNICHEHFYYHDLTSISNICSETGLEVYDVSFNDTNGGSFRVFLRKSRCTTSFLKRFDCEEARLSRLSMVYLWEKSELNIRLPSTWKQFAHRVDSLKSQVVSFLEDSKRNNELVLGFGASTKGNTFLQYMGIGPELLPAIAEAQSVKFGKYTAGTGIPIISEKDAIAMAPNSYLVLPWHFVDFFRVNKKSCLPAGGDFVVPCPKFQRFKV